MKKEAPSKADNLAALQRAAAELITQPLTASWRSSPKLRNGSSRQALAQNLIKPNDRLSSVERIEIYNRQYWFRLLDNLYDDFPGVRTVLGEDKFLKLRIAYLERHPADSFTLRDLGREFPRFIERSRKWGGKHHKLLVDMARFEWAQIVAFDSERRPPPRAELLARSNPAKLKLELQPYITLLELSYPLDQFVIALRNEMSERSEAGTLKRRHAKRQGLNLPRAKRVFLVVHRLDNALYFKRLERPAFAMLKALQQGKTLEAACNSAGKLLGRSENKTETIQNWFITFSALGWFGVPIKRSSKVANKSKRRRL